MVSKDWAVFARDLWRVIFGRLRHGPGMDLGMSCWHRVQPAPVCIDRAAAGLLRYAAFLRLEVTMAQGFRSKRTSKIHLIEPRYSDRHGRAM